MLEAIYVHFSMPSKNKKLQEMQKHLNIKPCTLSQISDTRWICRYKNCKAVIDNYKSIINILKQEVEDNNDRDVSRAIGL